jgi:hypothetical protein
MQLAFGHFVFQDRQRVRSFGGSDDAALGILVQQVEDALRMFLIHQDFWTGFGFEGN